MPNDTPSQGRVLIVDDNSDVLTAARLALAPHFKKVETLRTPAHLHKVLCNVLPQAVLLDMNFDPGARSGREGLEWLPQILGMLPTTSVVLMTAFGGVALAVEALKNGAVDFVAAEAHAGLAGFHGSNTASLDDLRGLYAFNPATAQQYGSFENWLNSLIVPVMGFDPNALHYTTAVNNNGLIPQLRGASGFNGSTSGALIVIDGFPQNSFDPNYSMVNVESIKVIKDPTECAKWGASGNGGVILITTKHGESGKLVVQYAANFYYAPSPRFDRNRQRLASSKGILDYLKSAYDSGFINYSSQQPGTYLFNETPAGQLLWGLNSGLLSQNDFARNWDSLGRMDNQGQLNMLQQNVFNQSHTLGLSGGSRNWRFRANGSYVISHTNALGNENHQYVLNMNNNFHLFHDKLKGSWLINVTRSNANAGHSFDTQNDIFQQPYQLLLDPKGNYLYDYSQFNPQANAVMMAAGYQNYGVNILQDARLNKTIAKQLTTSSSLNLEWAVLPCLKWVSSFRYDLDNSNSEIYKDAQSSDVRQLVDDHASPAYDLNGNIILDAAGKPILTYYVPQGGTISRAFTKNSTWNLRSALVFNKRIDKHNIFLTIGGNGSKSSSNTPSYSTLYGYDPNTGKGQPNGKDKPQTEEEKKLSAAN